MIITDPNVTKERQPPEIIIYFLMKVHTTTYEVYLLSQNKIKAEKPESDQESCPFNKGHS